MSRIKNLHKRFKTSNYINSLENQVFEKNARISYINYLLINADESPDDSLATRLQQQAQAQLQLIQRSSPQLDCEWCLLYGDFYLTNYIDSNNTALRYFMQGLKLAAENIRIPK